MYKMTLNDGTEITGLKMINNTLRRTEEMTAEMFRGKLSPVTITGERGEGEDEDWGGIAGTHEAMEVCYVKQIDGDYALALADPAVIDPDKWERKKLRADVDFALMLGGANF